MARRKKKGPLWWRPGFLRALGETGNARGAARNVGIDHGTAYAHARRSAAFERAWRRMLRIAEKRLAAQRLDGRPGGARIGASANRGEELIMRYSKDRGPQLVRPAEGRWTKAAEEIFFAELAATANVRAAARAAGFSTTAIYQRRMRCPRFRERWEAALDQGCARLEMSLMEKATRSFCGEEARDEVAENVSVHDAMAIVKLHRAKREGGARARGGRYLPKAPSIEDVTKSIIRKVEAIKRHRERHGGGKAVAPPEGGE